MGGEMLSIGIIIKRNDWYFETLNINHVAGNVEKQALGGKTFLSFAKAKATMVSRLCHS